MHPSRQPFKLPRSCRWMNVASSVHHAHFCTDGFSYHQCRSYGPFTGLEVHTTISSGSPTQFMCRTSGACKRGVRRKRTVARQNSSTVRRYHRPPTRVGGPSGQEQAIKAQDGARGVKQLRDATAVDRGTARPPWQTAVFTCTRAYIHRTILTAVYTRRILTGAISATLTAARCR